MDAIDLGIVTLTTIYIMIFITNQLKGRNMP